MKWYDLCKEASDLVGQGSDVTVMVEVEGPFGYRSVLGIDGAECRLRREGENRRDYTLVIRARGSA
jgi:hypothetical protein